MAETKIEWAQTAVDQKQFEEMSDIARDATEALRVALAERARMEGELARAKAALDDAIAEKVGDVTRALAGVLTRYVEHVLLIEGDHLLDHADPDSPITQHDREFLAPIIGVARANIAGRA